MNICAKTNICASKSASSQSPKPLGVSYRDNDKIKTMCDKCNFIQIYQFESETTWKKFDQDFTKTYLNQLTLIKENKLNLTSICSYDLYKCKSCDNLWTYSYPENAWRGFFLPEKLAIEYEKKLKYGDRIRGFVGLTILTIILIAILRGCIN